MSDSLQSNCVKIIMFQSSKKVNLKIEKTERIRQTNTFKKLPVYTNRCNVQMRLN